MCPALVPHPVLANACWVSPQLELFAYTCCALLPRRLLLLLLTLLLLLLPPLLLPLLPAVHAFSPTSVGAVMQPMPTVQVELDKQGTLVVSSTAPLGRQQWQAMAKASGWAEGVQPGLVSAAAGPRDVFSYHT